MGLSKVSISKEDVILVEDIVDTGLSTSMGLQLLKTENPASLKLCALLDKPTRRRISVKIDYLGMTIGDRFIVGYGADINQQYRQLPAIYVLEE